MSSRYNWDAIIEATARLRQYVLNVGPHGISDHSQLDPALIECLEALILDAQTQNHANDSEAPRILGAAHYELAWYYSFQHKRNGEVADLSIESAYAAAARHIAHARFFSFYTIPEEQVPDILSHNHEGKSTQSPAMRLLNLKYEQGLLHANASIDSDYLKNRLVEVCREVVALGAREPEKQWQDLSLLASALRTMGMSAGSLTSLNEAITIHTELLQEDQDHRQQHSGNLANALLSRYAITNSHDDVRRGWLFTQMSWHSSPETADVDARRKSVLNLVNAADLWFAASGDLDALAFAASKVSHEAQILEQEIQEGHSTETIDAVFLLNSAVLLDKYSEAAGNYTERDQAVAYARLAVKWLPYGEQSYSARLILAAQLSKRALLTGSDHDLDEAIEIGQNLLDDGPINHRARHQWLSNHVRHLTQKARADGSADFVEQALTLAEQAVESMEPTDASASRTLEAAIDAYLMAARLHTDTELANKAILYAFWALKVTPPKSSERARKIARLAAAHSLQHDLTNNISSLEAAFTFSKQAFDEDRSFQAERAGQAYNAGLYAYHIAESTSDHALLHISLSWLDKAIEHNPAPGTGFEAEVLSARIWELLHQPEKALASYQRAVGMLRVLAWQGLDPVARVGALFGRGEIVARAVDLAVHADDLEGAIRLAEEGRHVLWKQDIEFMADLSSLDSVAPSLARELNKVRNKIRALEDGADARLQEPASGIALDEEGMRRQLWRRWDDLIIEATALDLNAEWSFQGTDVSRLVDAIGERTFITVVPGIDHGHALIVRSGTIDSIELPFLTLNEAEQRRQQLGEVIEVLELGHTDQRQVIAKQTMLDLLAWQWRAIVEPVQRHLSVVHQGTLCPSGSKQRLWWCMTGPCAGLPVHATLLPDDTYLFDSCVSSQADSLTSLARATASKDEQVRSLGLLSAATTPGQKSLKFADAEIAAVGELIPSQKMIDARRSTALKAFANFPGVHLACHGLPQVYDAAPKLLLTDGAVHMSRIARNVNAEATWAYISACSTAEHARGFEDEGLTIAAAFQAAGFKHVIGTLWSINDYLAVHFASLFYERAVVDGCLRPDLAAEALSSVTAEVARTFPDHPALWTSYVHMGP